MISLTSKGERHDPQVFHHFAAWGGIKELLRVRGGTAPRKEVLEVLKYCGHHNEKHCPNRDYLDYAIKSGWLSES